MTSFKIHHIAFQSPEYEQSLLLRDEILRKPLGMSIYDDPIDRESRDNHFAAITSAGVVIGVSILTPIDQKTVRMRQVAVSPEYRGLGAGKQLICFCEQFARDHGFTHITLDARCTAQDFYQKLAYRSVSECFLEVSIPHVKMEKHL